MTKQWVKWRDVIQTLYISEGKTLEDVRAIMQEKHGFMASTRSYRQQFDKWGIAKYNCKKRNGRRQQQQQQQQQQHQHQHRHHQRRPRRSPSQPAPVAYSSPESTSTDADHQVHHQHQQEPSYSPDMMAVSQAYSSSDEPEYTYAPVQAVPAPLPPAQTSYLWNQEEQQQPQHDRWRNIAPMGAAGLPSPPADMDTAFFMSAAAAAPEMEVVAPQPVHPQSTFPVLSHHGGGQGQQQHHHHHHRQQQQPRMMMAQHHPQSRRPYETTYETTYEYPIRCYRPPRGPDGYQNQRPPGGPGQQ